MARLCELYPGICLTTEEKARKNLSQGSRRMSVGKEYREEVYVSVLVMKTGHYMRHFVGKAVRDVKKRDDRFKN